jgi:glycerol-3-phosphate acyltransferase PlsX
VPENPVHLAIDVMGGDAGPDITLPACREVLLNDNNITLSLFGSAVRINSAFARELQQFASRIEVVDCAEEVSMDDKPSSVIRNKQQSSMYRAVEAVACGNAQACVSAGNTGAFMALGVYLVKTFPGIDRPAICAEMPTEQGSCYLLDLGANVDSHSDHLHQFAVMGSVMASTLKHIDSPRVGLLNIGEEEIKGNEQVKLAASLLEKNENLNYIGYVEGDALYRGDADVVVCDGFVGNVVLKASEGVARLIVSKIQQTLKKGFFTRLLAFFSRHIFTGLLQEIDPSRYNGASLLGLQGSLVVSHGSADSQGFARAINLAAFEAREQLPDRINSQLLQLDY